MLGNSAIMQRFDRLTSILIRLQSRRLVTAREIADQFEVSIRTIYRDIQALRQAGVPIGEEEGRGYFLMEGYRLPPVMFTPEEAKALVAIQQMLHYHTEESLKRNFESALGKIKAVLDPDEKAKLDYLEANSGYYQPWAPSSQWLEQVQIAVAEHRKIQLVYQAKNAQVTQRTIRPQGLYFNGATWLTIAYCEKRHDTREFRLDRIQEMHLLSETFRPDGGFSIEDYLAERARKLFQNP